MDVCKTRCMPYPGVSTSRIYKEKICYKRDAFKSWNKDEGLVRQVNDFIVVECSCLCEGM